MSRSGAYRAAAAGLLPVVVIGGRRRLRLDDVYALAGTRPAPPPSAPQRPIIDHG